VTDKEILAAYKLLAAREGVFVEPASAASVAGVLKLTRAGYFKEAAGRDPQARIVCILTGHGLKDPDRAIASIAKPKVLAARLKTILKEIGV